MKTRAIILSVEVGMGRPVRGLALPSMVWAGMTQPAQGQARCPLRGLWACHGQKIYFMLIRTQACLSGSWAGPRAECLFFFVF